LALTETERQFFATLRVRFHPVWNIRNNMITGYRCGLSRMGDDITIQQVVALLGPGPADIIKAKIDAAVYAQAVNGVQYLLQQSQQAVLIVPIHYSTVDHLRYMTPLLEVGSNLPAQATSLLVFEFLEFTQNTSRFRLREPVSYLRTRARALLGRIGLDFSNLDLLAELNFHGISLDLGDYAWPEPRLMPVFESFVVAAQRRRLQPFIHGIKTPSLTVAAISAGFTYVDGPAISHPSDIPANIQAFGVHSMYGDWRRPMESQEALVVG
jgi:EAL domain-containing protein (putative c-di-GMP-specific phosphodiesterase class I)